MNTVMFFPFQQQEAFRWAWHQAKRGYKVNLSRDGKGVWKVVCPNH